VFLIPSASVITDRKMAEAALRKAQKMEAVGQLAAGVAHEFNNILQTLMSMATIVRLQAIRPDIAKIATEMEAQIRRGAGVTQQLLLSSRHQELTMAGLDLCEQVATAHDLLRRLIPENIALLVETSVEPASVQGDAGQIQQVLLNLVINARDAMPDGGTLTLRVACEETEVILEVEDDGTGFGEATREHLFEPFFTTKALGKGTGLGLAVVYGIVEQHGGRIEVRSQPGEGSLFRVLFPRTAHEPSCAEPAAEGEVAGATGRILLVEDEEQVRFGITVLLEMIGYEVIAVERGEEAMALPAEPVPDLLLSDVSLPGVGGPALAQLLRERWPLLKVVLMTGYFDPTTRELSREQGWEVLQKPFEVDELRRQLADAIGHVAVAS
jgi:two-component system cell cycle sensor histidine kinase/response regulator CckA